MSVEVEAKTCPECKANGIIHDPETGEDVCSSCGLVLNSEGISNTADWHSYNEQEKRHHGNPETFALHDKGAMTRIGDENRDCYGRQLPASTQADIHRLRMWQTRARMASNRERNLTVALREIGLAADKLHLPLNAREKACFLYRKAADKNMVRGRDIRDVAAAAVYLACRDNQVVYDVTKRYGVYLVTGGGSQSTPIIWESAQNFKAAIDRGQKLKILYFGDLNATGKNMIPDILRRLKLYGVVNVELVEVALNEADVLRYNLPRNPEKPGDSRAKWFAEKYPSVKYSVELDALSPEILRSKIRIAIESNLDMNKLRAQQAEDNLIRSITQDRLRNFVV